MSDFTFSTLQTIQSLHVIQFVYLTFLTCTECSPISFLESSLPAKITVSVLVPVLLIALVVLLILYLRQVYSVTHVLLTIIFLGSTKGQYIGSIYIERLVVLSFEFSFIAENVGLNAVISFLSVIFLCVIKIGKSSHLIHFLNIACLVS